ncbi:MAG: ABC transporter substrate-binding protein, partial [candidate division NC10 bacterium]|nr:ABC transporter substrate-binding protein [candidate division NC10 bacterium]
RLKGYPYDPRKAREFLAKAGYPNGRGLPTLQIWSSVKSEAVLKEHEAFRKYLADIGVQVEFQYNTDWPTFRSMVYKGELPIFRYGWVADVPDPNNFLNALFHSKSPNNLTNYRNPAVDRLLARARGEFDYMKRVDLYRQVERKVMEDAPLIPISYYTYERIFQPYVKAVKVSALGDPYIPMKRIWLERNPTGSKK